MSNRASRPLSDSAVRRITYVTAASNDEDPRDDLLQFNTMGLPLLSLMVPGWRSKWT